MSQTKQAADAQVDPNGTARRESRFHNYVGNRIPWYIRLLWLGFWVFAIYYVIKYLFPDLQTEILNPP
ncbi:MAG: hypothetical protein U0805_06155 [Pirellulales bacterium]